MTLTTDILTKLSPPQMSISVSKFGPDLEEPWHGFEALRFKLPKRNFAGSL